MYQIPQITSDPVQIQNVTLYDGSILNFQIRWSPNQLGWFFDTMTWTGPTGQFFSNSGMRVYNSPNMLRQWKNLLTFGLACQSVNAREPSLQQDFSSQTSNLFVLTAAEVQVYEAFLSGTPQWSATTSYYKGNVVYDDTGVFESLTNSNIGNATSDTTYWTTTNG